MNSLAETLKETHLNNGAADSACKPEQVAARVSKSYHERIPVVDMGGLDGDARDSTIADISKACEEWGFFQVINHGIPETTLDRTKKIARDFFDLPAEEKLTCAVKPGSPAGFYSKEVSVGDNVLIEQHVDHFYHRLLPLALKNADPWPTRPTAYREVMDEYTSEIRKVSRQLLAVCAISLGLRETFFEEWFGEPTHSMRVNYYPPCPMLDTSTVGLGAHSDPGGITVLLQGDTAGLQVRAKDGNWVEVQPVPNAFVINVGDQIEILTNGRYKSVEHRGMISRSNERLSLAAFYSPSRESLIGPAPELTDDTQPAIYKATTYADYFMSFLQRGLDGKSHVKSISTSST